MAFTISTVQKTVFGNLNVRALSCTVDSASGNVDTGLSVVEFFTVTPISMATASPILKRNIGSNTTARPGIININGAASGDVFFLVAYGR